MKDLRQRKYKNYTVVYIDNFTRKTAIEARDLCKSIVGNAVVKPSKKGLLRYIREYKPYIKIKATKVGESFEIAGVVFKVLEKYGNGLIELQCNDEIFEIYEDADSLIEDVYKNITGTLLFF